MRVKLGQILVFLFLLMSGGAFPLPSVAQNPDTMMPEQSAAKGRQILGQLIEALGGPAYLEVRERECDGRRAQFGHNGELTGYVEFKDYWRYPDKHRTDYAKKGNIADVFDGNQGWTLDRSGVSEEPASSVAEFQEALKRNVDNLLRVRLTEKDLNVRFAGAGLVDMRPVDWVEVTEADRTMRLAVDKSSHLLLRSVAITTDEDSRERTEETTIYSNYQRKDGVLVPLQISRDRDGRRFYQAFYETCRFNSGLPGDLFTKASLEQRFAQVGSKKDKEKSKHSRD